MKSLLIIRHAKSDRGSSDEKAFDRKLNERGKRDAPEMAKRLLNKDIKIDGFISSPAERAFSTCALFAKAYDAKEKNIIKAPQLYEAPAEAFFNVIAKTEDKFDSIAVFGHNPGATSFVNLLTGTQVDNMPTCAVFAVKAAIKHWKDFEAAEKTFWFFDYPKSKD